MSMTFRVGQKVCCVDTSKRPTSLVCPPLRLYAVYTISGLGQLSDGEEELILLEQPGYTKTGAPASDFGYRASRFRPVVSRKTDISIFKAMLSPSQVTVDAMNIADCGREIVR